MLSFKIFVTASCLVILAVHFVHAFDSVAGKSDLNTQERNVDLNANTDETKRETSQLVAQSHAQAEEETVQKTSSKNKRLWNVQSSKKEMYLREISKVRNETVKCFRRLGWSVKSIPQYTVVVPKVQWWWFDDRRRKRYYLPRNNYQLNQLHGMYLELKDLLDNCTQVEKRARTLLVPIMEQVKLLKKCFGLKGDHFDPNFLSKIKEINLPLLQTLLKILINRVGECFTSIGYLPNGEPTSTTSTTTTTTTTTTTPTTTSTTTTTTTPEPTTTTTTLPPTTTPIPTTTPGIFTTTAIPTTTIC